MRTVEPIMNTLFTITELQLKPHKHSIRHFGGFQTHLRHRHIQMYITAATLATAYKLTYEKYSENHLLISNPTATVSFC